MHVLVGEGGAKLRFQHVVDRADNEVHTFHGGIHRAELLHRERKGTLEKLLVEVLDNGLLALEVVYLAHIDAHRLVE